MDYFLLICYMLIETIETNDLKIIPTKQTIDSSLGVPLPFPDKNSCIVVSGGMGTGKTTFMNSIMTNKVMKVESIIKKF